MNHAMYVRKGVTPVVAIVMLLLLVMVVAGGVFAFVNTFMTEQEQELMEEQDTEVEFSSVSCDSIEDEISFTITNQGPANINLETVDFFITDAGDGDLVDGPVEMSSEDPVELTREERHWSDTIGSEEWNGELQTGHTYRIEVDFVSNGVGEASASCTP